MNKNARQVRISESEADVISKSRGVEKSTFSRGGRTCSYRVNLSPVEFETILSMRKGKNHRCEQAKISHPVNADIDKKPIGNKILDEIASKYSPEELKSLAKGGGLAKEMMYAPVIHVGSVGRHKIGIMTDTHIGSKYSISQNIIDAIERFERDKCEMIIHPGDVTEGYSGREGHVYECTHFGFDSQLAEATRIFSHLRLPLYAIDGNHDRWGMNKLGANIVKAIDMAVPNFHHIGSDMATMKVGSATIMPWHGEDGSSYATSYRIQKIIESLQGGTKPNILLCGHAHKYAVIFERNIHAIACGSMQFQTSWMRGKRLASHTGYIEIEFEECDGSIISFTTTFLPLYVQ